MLNSENARVAQPLLPRLVRVLLALVLMTFLLSGLEFSDSDLSPNIQGAIAQPATPAGPAAALTKSNNPPEWVENILPDYLVGLRLLEIRLWQWFILLLLVVGASMVGLLAASVIVRVAVSLVRRTETTWDDSMVRIMAAPLRFIFAILLFYLGMIPLGLPARGHDSISVLCKVGAILAVTWFVLRLADSIAAFAERRFEERGAASAKNLVPIGRRATKIFVLILAALSLLQNLGFNVGGLLAGLGIGGIAIALAAQKSLENLIGGVLVLADRPVKVGDFCRVGDHIGTVEDIGLRSSRIRTLDRTVVAIPNAEFSTVRIESYAVRDKMRLFSTIQVGYDTSPDQLRYLLVEIREMLYAHPKTLVDPCRVRFVNFGAYSLDLEVFVFIETKDWNEFLGIREDIFLRIMDIVERSGAYFAYPSQTLYLGRDHGRDIASTDAAEKAVAEWRRDSKIPLPEFSPDRLMEIDNTLEFPPEGSAVRPV